MKVYKGQMRRVAALSVCALLCLGGCGIGGGDSTYRKAVRGLKDTEVAEDGTYAVTEELIIASQNAEYVEPKNIIYMIGDGMGYNIIEATRAYYSEQLYEGTMAIDYVPQVGWQSTYSADAQITDSAAGGTALATGFKTSNGTIAMDKYDKTAYKTVLELAAENGMSTGIIATKSVTDATPASFTAHAADRGMEDEIAVQQLEKLKDGTLDLVLGGGLQFFTMGENMAALNQAVQQGVSYTAMWEETLETELPLLGLYASSHLDTYNQSLPTVAEMTEFALEKLSKDKNGFFLMVEGSQIDTKAHENSYYNEMKEMYDFDCAIGVALKFVAMNPDTALIITADHETGELHLPGEDNTGVSMEYYYGSGGHTSIQVPVYAIGYGVENLGGIKENTDVAKFVASLLGEDEFGQKSDVYTLVEKGEEPIKVSFDENQECWELPRDLFLRDLLSVKNSRAMHIRVKNTGNKEVHLPALLIEGNRIDTCVAPQRDFLDGGEEIILTYVLPNECWENAALGGVKKMTLSYEPCTVMQWEQYLLGDISLNATFEITEIFVTDRVLDN